MDTVTDAQRQLLDAVIARLEDLPVAELIREAHKLTLVLEPIERQKTRTAFFMGSCYAISKTIDYLVALRSIDETREILGRRMHALLEERQRCAYDAEGAARVAWINVEVFRLSGQQEVTYHLFTVLISQIRHLLPIAARGAGTKVTSADEGVLESFKNLRDHYEHLHARLPGKNAKPGLSTEYGDETEWHVRLEVPVDEVGRIVLNGDPIDVTTRGVEAVSGIVERTWVAMRSSAVDMVRSWFTSHPEHIPDPDQINIGPIGFIGGFPVNPFDGSAEDLPEEQKESAD